MREFMEVECRKLYAVDTMREKERRDLAERRSPWARLVLLE